MKHLDSMVKKGNAKQPTDEFINSLQTHAPEKKFPSLCFPIKIVTSQE